MAMIASDCGKDERRHIVLEKYELDENPQSAIIIAYLKGSYFCKTKDCPAIMQSWEGMRHWGGLHPLAVVLCCCKLEHSSIF
jgi:hypothetical protein